MTWRSIVLGVLVAAAAVPARAGAGKWSGEAFGDAYWFAAHHDSTLEDHNGVWFRRLYLTYDYKFNDRYSARARLETASPSDFSASTMIPFMKDLWLKWSNGTHDALFGLQPTPTWNVIEVLWGYRSVEKTPLDLQGYGTARDLGLGVQGAFGAGRRAGYHALLANGSGTKSETNTKKKVMGAVSLRPSSETVVEIYADYEDRVGEPDRATYQAFAGYRSARLRAGAQYALQIRNTTGDDLELGVVSGFVTGAVSRSVWLIARVDRQMDPNPSGEKIPYLPFDSEAANTFVLAGIDWVLWEEKNDSGRLVADAHVVPNVEMVLYDDPETGGERPDTDVVPRVTFAFRF
jgi:hypothetical protein